MERFYRDKDIAKAFGISRNTVWRWARNGTLPPPVKLSPSCSRWSESDIKAITARARAA